VYQRRGTAPRPTHAACALNWGDGCRRATNYQISSVCERRPTPGGQALDIARVGGGCKDDALLAGVAFCAESSCHSDELCKGKRGPQQVCSKTSLLGLEAPAGGMAGGDDFC
jgi:hypothetical protein